MLVRESQGLDLQELWFSHQTIEISVVSMTGKSAVGQVRRRLDLVAAIWF